MSVVAASSGDVLAAFRSVRGIRTGYLFDNVVNVRITVSGDSAGGVTGPLVLRYEVVTNSTMPYYYYLALCVCLPFVHCL